MPPTTLSSHRQNELKEGAQRSVGRQYFYVDFQRFCNVVKWRVSEMRRRIDTGLRNVELFPTLSLSIDPTNQPGLCRNWTTKAIFVPDVINPLRH